MPVAMKCGEDYGCAGSIVRFVIPMGTNINRDGAALYEAVSVMFICQVPHSSSGFHEYKIRKQNLLPMLMESDVGDSRRMDYHCQWVVW